MADPEVSGNNAEYQKLVRAMSEIQDAVEAYAAYKDVERQLADAKEMLKASEGGGVSQSRLPILLHRASSLQYPHVFRDTGHNFFCCCRCFAAAHCRKLNRL
jgi:hypothetical protein